MSAVQNPHKKPTLGEARQNAARFAKRWAGTTRENAETQLFWAEFLKIFGVDHKRTILFERHADRLSTGRPGRIDVFWPGELLIEQKSFGKDLTKAADQAFDYLDGLPVQELPDQIIVSDFENFEVHDLTVSPIHVTKFTLKQLPQRIGLFMWMAGYTRRPSAVTDAGTANKKAVKRMAELYDALAHDNLSDHQTSVILARMLFLLFAEDTGLMERGLFAQIIRDRSAEDGSDLGGLMGQIFQVLDTHESRRSERTDELMLQLPYVNGSVFSEQVPLVNFDRAMRDAILAATDFEWGTISPAIFGSMFQAVKSKELRRELGEHYTSEENILRTLGPLFLDGLKKELKEAEYSRLKLNRLWDKIAGMRFLDPACGCGNFLIITYRELREIELQIMDRLQNLEGSSQVMLVDESAGLKVSLEQFHGIEIEEWPARIAEVALFITDHQANRRMLEVLAEAPNRLPLRVSAKIVVANALRTDWERVLPASDSVVIVGNPPFSGQGKVTEEQTEDLKVAWGKSRYHGYLDLVTGWFVKAVDYFGKHEGRWAFVSTSSICQGEPVQALFKPIYDASWHIGFAHRGFNWKTEATGKAGVHVSITGFTRESGKRQLFEYGAGGREAPRQREVKSISPYLVEGRELYVTSSTKPVNPQMPIVTKGNQPTDGGNLIVKAEVYPQFVADSNAAKYLRRFPGAKELINDKPRWCLWMVDLEPSDVQKSALLRERIEGVRQMRLGSSKANTRAKANTPHLFDENRQPDSEYLAIPRHYSAGRLYCTAAYFGPEVIQSDANFMAADEDGFLFGIFSSSLFMSWQRMVGGRIRDDLRFSNTLVWNTFPLPESFSEHARKSVTDAAAKVQEAREAQPGRSLAEMYNPLAMRQDLLKAHRELDQSVFKLFSLRKVLHDEGEKQELLFSRYTEMIDSK
ncbi:hypothetical protein M2368_001350 [Arthrobacter sp. JUb119]|nr:hypothetical protein [Arthrobacter sp. JUb119]